jgi:hypothetical protein
VVFVAFVDQLMCSGDELNVVDVVELYLRVSVVPVKQN